MKILVPVVLALFSIVVNAQEQLALRLNEQGILKILKMTVQYNTAKKESRAFIIPENIYRFTIPKSNLLSNPIIPLLNEISDLNLNKDLDFYLKTSDILITGDVDVKSVRAKIFNSSDAGFDLRLTLHLPRVLITAPRLSLCEDKKRGKRMCGNGLKTTVSNLSIKTKKRPVIISAILRLRTDGKVVRVSLESVSSNLEGRGAPELDINFRAIDVPKISVIVNDEVTVLDTSRLKKEILKRERYLAKKLFAFAGDFIANDLAEMINQYLIHQEVVTSYQLYRKENPVKFEDYLSLRSRTAVRDNTYYRPPIVIPRDEKVDPWTVMLTQVSELVRQAQVDLSLKRISTPLNKDIELGGILNFILNNQRIKVRETIGNSRRTLPRLDLTHRRNSDLSLAISEPLINGALDLGSASGLFQEIYSIMSRVPGFSVKNVKLHFDKNNSIIAVVNAQVDLRQVAWVGVRDWFEKKIAAWLERNNNNSVIFFPIEITIIPIFKNLPNGEQGLDLMVLSPFKGESLTNRFNYPSNVPRMKDSVKVGVMEELRESLEPYTNKSYTVGLSRFLNQSGVVFAPRAIEIVQGAYLLMSLDIVDIKFDSRHPVKR